MFSLDCNKRFFFFWFIFPWQVLSAQALLNAHTKIKCQTLYSFSTHWKFVTRVWLALHSRERIRIFAPRDNDAAIDVNVDHNVHVDSDVIVASDVNADDEIWSFCHQCVTRFAFLSNIFTNKQWCWCWSQCRCWFSGKCLCWSHLVNLSAVCDSLCIPERIRSLSNVNKDQSEWRLSPSQIMLMASCSLINWMWIIQLKDRFQDLGPLEKIYRNRKDK